jgi:hypothetical protein
MTSCSFCFLKHVKDEAELAQHAAIGQTTRGSVLKRHISEKRGVVHELQQRIGITVGNVIFQTGVFGLVEEPRVLSVLRCRQCSSSSQRTQNRSHRRRICCT